MIPYSSFDKQFAAGDEPAQHVTTLRLRVPKRSVTGTMGMDVHGSAGSLSVRGRVRIRTRRDDDIPLASRLAARWLMAVGIRLKPNTVGPR